MTLISPHVVERSRSNSKPGLALLALAAIAGAGSVASAQARPTAIRTYSQSVFGGYAQVYPDYSNGGSGYVLGGDLTRNFGHYSPSLEVRYTHGGGSAAEEGTLLTGLKVEKHIDRFHPYGFGLIGVGNIFFPLNRGTYFRDNSTVFALGGGCDFDLTEHFALKGDFQFQHWKVGTEVSALTPEIVSVGVVYRLPALGLKGVRR